MKLCVSAFVEWLKVHNKNKYSCMQCCMNSFCDINNWKLEISHCMITGWSTRHAALAAGRGQSISQCQWDIVLDDVY